MIAHYLNNVHHNDAFSKKQDRETRSMTVPEVTIYNLLLKPQAFLFECLYLKKTTGNLSIYVPQK